MGAATALFASFSLKFLLEIIVGYRLFPVPYEYGRIARLVLLGAAIYIGGTWVPWGSLWVSVPAKGLLLLCAPLLLYATGFFETAELSRLRGSLTGLRRWSSGFLEARGDSQ
jgi:hypothetical protein